VSVVERIRAQLASLDPRSLEIVDDSARHAGHAGARDGGGHYRLRIVADCFSGLSAMRRHRMVYDALGLLMRREIHALSIDAQAPDESSATH